MNANERHRIKEMIEEYQKIHDYYEPRKLEPLYNGVLQAYVVVIKDLKELIKEPKPIERLTHCPACDSMENQDYCSFTEKTQCKQCSCVYGAYGGEVWF